MYAFSSSLFVAIPEGLCSSAYGLNIVQEYFCGLATKLEN